VLGSSLPDGCWGFTDRIAHAHQRLRPGASDESGFTLIELMIVCLIIGVLAAIAIPAFSNQTNKAVDTQAKVLVRTAATTSALLAADNSGDYTKVSLAELHKYEPSILITKSASDAYLTAATGKGIEYSVTATSTNGDEFTISQNATGELTRSCVSPTTKKGCNGKEAGSW
jgi:type IV pilus assembly protein PilA